MNSQSETTGKPRSGCRRWGCLLLTIPLTPLIVFILFISLLSPPLPAASSAPLPPGVLKGISLESRETGELSSEGADRTLSEIVVPTGADWVAVIVTCYQETRLSTRISCAPSVATATDDDVRHAIVEAHSLGLNVMFKPHVDLSDMVDAMTGRFHIGFGDDEHAWAAWFDSYTRMMTHYARIAQELDVEYFAVGTELSGTVHRTAEWRGIIDAVKAIYVGPLTYAALSYVEPLQVGWWDELDSIGIDAYFAVSLSKRPTLEQMRLGWLPTVAYLGWLAERFDKPIILTEVGYMSVDGTNILPGFWSLDGEVDPQEQATPTKRSFRPSPVTTGGRAWSGGRSS